MYAAPTSSGTDLRQSTEYAAARDAAGSILQLVHLDYQRSLQLHHASHYRPLTALERLELSSLCSMLGNALHDAAEVWDTYRAEPELGIAASYRRHARVLYDTAALNEALVSIAPSSAGEDPFTTAQ